MIEEYKSAFGHICSGGNASIEDSPINIHIHIHTNTESVGLKISRAIHGLLNRERHISIDGAAQLSESELSGKLYRSIENG